MNKTYYIVNIRSFQTSNFIYLLTNNIHDIIPNRFIDREDDQFVRVKKY